MAVVECCTAFENFALVPLFNGFSFGPIHDFSDSSSADEFVSHTEHESREHVESIKKEIRQHITQNE